jgi:hypothetical protein
MRYGLLGRLRATIVEKMLIGGGVLNYGGGLPFDRKRHGAFGFLELFHEVAGPSSEAVNG